jgi:nitrogen fixation NifU-like protein
MAYSDKVIDHYEHPRNVGVLDKDATNVGTGMVGAPACGDVMRLQIQVNDDGIIKNTDIAEELALPPVKVHCSVLAEDAIRAAISDYQSKRDS